MDPQPDETGDAADRFLRLCLCARLSQVGVGPTEGEGRRGSLDAAGLAAERARFLAGAGGIDWERLCQVAADNRLAPLLYHVVRRQGLVPPQVEAMLRAGRQANAVRDTLLERELVPILSGLGQVGVKVIVLKGAALAHTVYEPGLRPMSDLDLLVRPADVPAAVWILGGLGFQAAGVEARPGVDLAYESQVMLCKPGRMEIAVEVHWTLFDSPYYQQELPLEWFWQTAVGVRIGPQPALVLGAEAQLLHLCGHLLLHHSRGQGKDLLWRHDVAEVLAFYGDGLDWDTLLRQAEVCHLVLALQQVLGELAVEGCVPLPAGPLARLRALPVTAEEARAVARLTAGRRPVARRFWADLASMAGCGERLGYARIHLFPSAEYMCRRYGIRHRRLVPLYYPYRWWVGLRGGWG